MPEHRDVGALARLRAEITRNIGGGAHLGITDEIITGIVPDAIIEPWRDTMLHWSDLVTDYHRRFAEYAALLSNALSAQLNRWVPIGPAVVRRGQSGSERLAMAGRAVDMALAPALNRVYLATASGGVWRSDDDGHTWYSTMEAWDLNPQQHNSASLACGAIAVDPTNPDRVFVGTGEGPTSMGYQTGVGPIYSPNGGDDWHQEPATTDATPTATSATNALMGQTFWALAIDPGDPQRAVGATEIGMFRREPAPAGLRFPATATADYPYIWRRTLGSNATRYTSVVVARVGTTTTFYAARLGDKVYASADGNTPWNEVGEDFPTANVSRIALAVRADATSTVLYAFVTNTNDNVHGVYRYDSAVDQKWRPLRNMPEILNGSGWYNLAIAVDPTDANRLYVAGGGHPNQAWSEMRRIIVSGRTASGNQWQATYRAIGSTVHADTHRLVIDPSDHNRLWVACDGGVYRCTNATEDPISFLPMNTGLATLQGVQLCNHPTQDGVMLMGTQDNGTMRYLGSGVWTGVEGGDGGWAVINWENTHEVCHTFFSTSVGKAIDGGNDWGSFRSQTVANVTNCHFYAPLVGTPPGGPAGSGSRVAFGGTQINVNDTFGTWNTPQTGWPMPPASWPRSPGTRLGALLAPDPNVLHAFTSLEFQSYTRIYGVTNLGEVWRFDENPAGSNSWSAGTALHGGNLPARKFIADVATVPGNADAIWVCFAGQPNPAHGRVWYYDGTTWHDKSGSGNTGLLDVQHHTIVVDPANAQRVFVGADIGVWVTLDGGDHWMPYSQGMPDCSVRDLKIFQPRRLIRASAFGRGVWERSLDDIVPPNVELWVRDYITDTGRGPTGTTTPDPTTAATPQPTLDPAQGPDIKCDVPNNTGVFQTRTTRVDVLQFADQIADRSDRVGTVTEARGSLPNRVFVQVQTRGVRTADDVRVTLLIAEAPGGVPPALPAGYTAHVAAGTDITGGGWQTVGRQPLTGVRAGHGRVAGFELPSTLLPRPDALSGHDRWCLLALLHHTDDPYAATETNPVTLSRNERKAALKHIRVQSFTGTMPLTPAAVAWYRIQPMISNVPLCGDPPEFRIYGEENGRATVELAWDPEALMAPSGQYDGDQALRYYNTAETLDKTFQKADGSSMRVLVPAHPVVLSSNRTTWTVPRALWEGYRALAAKTRAPRALYYRVRVQPTGSTEAVAWPADTVISGNVDAPHVGLLGGTPPATIDFPDEEGRATLPGLWRVLVWLCWALLPADDPDKQSLQRIVAHADYTAMPPEQRGNVLELWLVAGPSSRQRLDQLLERRIWRTRTENRTALLSVDRVTNPKTLVERLLELRWIIPHPDLVGVASNEQLVDDVITEILDPNGQINQGVSGMGPLSAAQALLIGVSPAEYTRLMCGLLSDRSQATLANGDTVTVPPGVFQSTRYGTNQSGFRVRTNSELAFQAALLSYGQGPRFPAYNPSAAPNAAGGIAQVFAAVLQGGLTKTELNKVASGLFSVAFTASATGPSAALRTAFLSALDQRLQPLLLALRWGSATGTTGTSGHVVLGIRHNDGRLFIKNPEYAGSSPPADRTAGAQLTDPPRQVVDPTQSLESISEADLDACILWYHTPASDLVS